MGRSFRYRPGPIIFCTFIIVVLYHIRDPHTRPTTPLPLVPGIVRSCPVPSLRPKHSSIRVLLHFPPLLPREDEHFFSRIERRYAYALP